MEFEEVEYEEIIGTGFQGCVNATFNELVDAFGEPSSDGDGYKVDAEWFVKFKDGTVATIYNWKDGKNYLGEDGCPVENITYWHVGGHSQRAVELVLIKLGK